jgi:hypothetical protein
MPAYKYITHIGHLKVVHPNDGDDSYHIFIDNDYKGNVIKLETHWVADFSDTNDLTADEMQALGKIIMRIIKK